MVPGPFLMGRQNQARTKKGTVEQVPGHGEDAKQIAVLASSGAALGGLIDRSWKGAGIGAGVGSAVGLATVLMTRGKEVECVRALRWTSFLTEP